MSLLRSRSRSALAGAILLAATAAAVTLRDAPAEPAGFAASRRDLGDLIVLEVGGSYQEMGRQQADLLGDDLRRVYAVQRQEHEATVARGGRSSSTCIRATATSITCSSAGRWWDSRRSASTRRASRSRSTTSRPTRRWGCGSRSGRSAAGDLAMVECSPSRCAVFRPDGDWFGQANHARTPEMIPFDRYRSPDSFDRRAGIERAVAAARQ